VEQSVLLMIAGDGADEWKPLYQLHSIVYYLLLFIHIRYKRNKD
jgi:hypothetical protein